jgi:hypothetical protein
MAPEERGGDYTIDCDGEVDNVFIRIEKPSGRR